MGYRNGKYVFDFEPLKRFFGGVNKPNPAQQVKPVAPKPKKTTPFQAMGSHYKQIGEIERELRK